MSPANIENTIMAACPMVGAMITIGDARPYNTALMVFDADSVGPYAAQHGLADASPAALAADPEVMARIEAGVAVGNAKRGSSRSSASGCCRRYGSPAATRSP
jgi:long-chain acyl-CoA synthetase